MVITVCILSGIVYQGKTFWREILTKLFPEASQISMDLVRVQLWGQQKLTKIGHRFKNEATRQELMRLLVTHRPSLVFLEMPMLTHQFHQQPMVDMLQVAQAYLDGICEESGQARVEIKLRVILFYCSLAAVRERVQLRQEQIRREGNIHGMDIFDLAGYLNVAKQVEYPSAYQPLLIKTDETAEGYERNLAEVLAFLRGNDPVREEEYLRRKTEYLDILEEARRLE